MIIRGTPVARSSFRAKGPLLAAHSGRTNCIVYTSLQSLKARSDNRSQNRIIWHIFAIASAAKQNGKTVGDQSQMNDFHAGKEETSICRSPGGIESCDIHRNRLPAC